MATTDFPAGKVVLSAKDSTEIMTILSVNSTAKYNTCIPNIAAENLKDSQKIKDALMKQINVGFGSYIQDISKASTPLIIMGFLVIINTWIYILLLQCLTKPILYGSLLGIFVMLAGATYFSYDNFSKFEADAVDSTDYKFAMAILVICGILTVLYMILVCCMWKAISLGASVLETASDYIKDNKTITFLPFAAYILCLPVTIWWIFTSVYIYGLGTPIFVEKSFVADLQST